MQSIGGYKANSPTATSNLRARRWVVATPRVVRALSGLYFRSKLAATVESSIWIKFTSDNMQKMQTNKREYNNTESVNLIKGKSNKENSKMDNRSTTKLWNLTNGRATTTFVAGRKLIILLYLKPTRVILIPVGESWEVTRKQSGVNVVIAYFTRSRVSKRRFIEAWTMTAPYPDTYTHT